MNVVMLFHAVCWLNFYSFGWTYIGHIGHVWLDHTGSPSMAPKSPKAPRHWWCCRGLLHMQLSWSALSLALEKNKRAALQSRPGFEEWISWDIIGKHVSIPVRTRHSIQSLTAGQLSKLSKGKLLHSRSTNARHRSEAFPSIGSGAFTRLMMLEDQWTTVNYSN